MFNLHNFQPGDTVQVHSFNYGQPEGVEQGDIGIVESASAINIYVRFEGNKQLIALHPSDVEEEKSI